LKQEREKPIEQQSERVEKKQALSEVAGRQS
jgi:hypothetical protein